MNKVLRVAVAFGSRRDDADRGPAVWMNPEDAAARLITDGELAWVHGPRRHELAVVHVAAEQQRGDVRLRDVLGAAPSELVRVVKPGFDRREPRRDLLKRTL